MSIKAPTLGHKTYLKLTLTPHKIYYTQLYICVAFIHELCNNKECKTNSPLNDNMIEYLVHVT